MNKDDYIKCAQGVWSEAQKVEYSIWESKPPDGSDWNSWWASKVLYKILPRDEGRNSAYHYGTYIFIGKKR